MDPVSLWAGPQRLELITTDHHGVPGATVVDVLRVSNDALDFLLDARGEAASHLKERRVALLVGTVRSARARVDGRVRPLGEGDLQELFAGLSPARRRAWWGPMELSGRPPWVIARRLVPHRWRWEEGGETRVWVPHAHGWMPEPGGR